MPKQIEKAGIVLGADNGWRSQSQVRRDSAKDQAKGSIVVVAVDLNSIYLPTNGNHRSMRDSETAVIHAWLPVDFVITLAAPDSPVVAVATEPRDE